MSLSSDIAWGNTERQLVGKDQRIYRPDYSSRAGLLLERQRPIYETAPGDASPFLALEKQPITESPTMRSFVFNDITVPVAFKVTCSRRAQLWNRQASIIMDLTTLALRHGWRCLPISDLCAGDAFRSLVGSSSVSKEHSDS